MTAKRIRALLDAASVLADHEAHVVRSEQTSDAPYTHLAQLIDYALAAAEKLERLSDGA